MQLFPTCFLAAALLSGLPCAAAPAPSPLLERFSVASGKLLAAGETPAGEAVMTVYHPQKPNGTAVLIYPGGAYCTLVVEAEGHRIAKWIGEHGVTGVVVEYRLPHGNSAIQIGRASCRERVLQVV